MTPIELAEEWYDGAIENGADPEWTDLNIRGLAWKITQHFVPRDQSQCENELCEARQIIRALLGAPPPRTWKKWPNIHKRATEFLQHGGTG